MSVLVVTGTGTGVGKTVVTAAIAALAAADGRSVAVVKPAQTGAQADDVGDLAHVAALSGVAEGREFVRFPDALAPVAAARVAGRPPLDLATCSAPIAALAKQYDLVLVEGTGGLLVRYDEQKTTIAALAASLTAPLLVVAAPGLGTLNHTALTVEAVARRGLECAGVVIGSWPADPDLAARCNLTDLPRHGAAIVGALPAGAGDLSRDAFLAVARVGLGAQFGGTFDAADFAAAHAQA